MDLIHHLSTALSTKQVLEGKAIPVLFDFLLQAVKDKVLSVDDEESILGVLKKAYEKQQDDVFSEEIRRFDTLWKNVEKKQVRLKVDKIREHRYWHYHVDNDEQAKTIERFLHNVRKTVLGALREYTKIVYTLALHMKKTIIDENEVKEQRKIFYVSSCPFVLLTSDDFKLSYSPLVEYFNSKLAEKELEESGWTLEKIGPLSMKMTKYRPWKGGCLAKVPKSLARCVLSQVTKDEQCFRWAITLQVYEITHGKIIKNRCRVSQELRDFSSSSLNWKGISFPSTRRDCLLFEKRNPSYLVYCYLYQDKKISIFYRSNTFHQDKHHKKIINLLCYQHHFYPITSLPAFHRQCLGVHNASFVCQTCLSYFSSAALLQQHDIYCQYEYKTRVKIPFPGKFTFFQKYRAQLKHPLVVYLDIESILSPETTTTTFHHHQACLFGCLVLRQGQEKGEYFTFLTADDTLNFLDTLSEELTRFVPLSGKEREKGKQQLRQKREHDGTCDYCHRPEEEEDNLFVLHHCHYTGQFLGVLHNACNLKLQKRKTLPVFSHNMSGYDEKLIIRSVHSSKNHIIAKNIEQLITFSYENEHGITIQFLDSFQFLKSSLASLAENCGEDQLKQIAFFFGEQKSLFLRKGVFPYEYISSLDVLNETQLPSKEHFFSALTQTSISQEEYDYACHVWKTQQCQTLWDYLRLYLQVDVLLLADVMESFRERMMNMYGLDPTHYVTLSSLAFDCALKCSNVRLEQISDVTQMNFLERGIRGGICMISKRYAKANHKYLASYDSSLPSVFLLYLDANNLYPSTMYAPLPTSDFTWEKWTMKDVLDETKEAFLDVDVECPPHLHSFFQDYPLFPEKKEVNGQMKLMCDFYPKTHYVVHSDYLRYAISLGYVVTKIHCALTYKSQAWLKTFIEKNTEERKKAKTTFEKNLWKQMNNSVFGKTIENVRERRFVEMTQNEKEFVKATSKTTYKNFIELQENQCLIEQHKQSVTLNKPIYDGAKILDQSKHHMACFHYGYMKPKFGDRVQLLMTDTDSFLYEIQSEDVYQEIASDVEKYFDTSNMTKAPCPNFPIGKNKKKPGFFKDEMAGHFITEFIGLRPKQYCFSIEENEEVKKCKGLNKQAMKDITLNDFKEELHNVSSSKKYVDMYNIRSHEHILYTEKMRKKTLDRQDTKRFICSDGIHTLPFGMAA